MTSTYQTGDQSGQDIKDKLKQDVGNKAREYKEELTSQARDASQKLAEKGKDKAEALSSKAADVLENVGAAADAEADALEGLGYTNLSTYIREMADGIGGLSDNLRNKSADELIRSVTDLAHRNTGLFLLGSVAIGFGLSRFAKAATSANDSDELRDTDDSTDDAYSYPAAETRSFDAAASDEIRPFESH